MECERSSSTETGNRGRRSSTVAVGNRRMYECTFCKRGFTNAQALGGHMNIHRRDRAKTKQHANVNVNAEEESREQFQYINPNTNSTVHVQRCFPASLSGPNFSGGFEQDVLRTSLSLGIGRSNDKEETFEKRKTSVVVEGDEIDLELRLGS